MRASLATLVTLADARQEPARYQSAWLEDREVQLICCLDRAAVIEYPDGERTVIHMARLQVDPVALRWTTRMTYDWASGNEVTARRLSGQRGSANSHRRKRCATCGKSVAEGAQFYLNHRTPNCIPCRRLLDRERALLERQDA